MIFDNASAAQVAVEILLKGTLLIAAASASILALRGATATLRHLLWSVTLVAMLAIPALTLVLPRWNLGLLPVPSGDRVVVGNPVSNAVDPLRDVSGVSTDQLQTLPQRAIETPRI